VGKPRRGQRYTNDGISNLLLLAVLMFVFLGLLMEMTGIARGCLCPARGDVPGVGHLWLEGRRYGGRGADPLFRDAGGMHPGELSSLLATSSAMSEIPPSLGADHDRLGGTGAVSAARPWKT
jgi:hypothetical protein